MKKILVTLALATSLVATACPAFAAKVVRKTDYGSSKGVTLREFPYEKFWEVYKQGFTEVEVKSKAQTPQN